MNVTTQPTFEELMERAVFSQSDIVRQSGLSGPTVRKIARKQAVNRLTLIQALEPINRKLGTNYTPDNIDAPTL